MTIAVSGYFLWLHVGHIELFREAQKYGKLIVIVNNDEQQILKYGKIIVPLKERAEVLKDNKNINIVVKSIDNDRTVCKTLERIKPDIFANGGDRISENIPEIEICEQLNIRMIFGLGEKIQSSSDLILNYENTNGKTRPYQSGNRLCL